MPTLYPRDLAYLRAVSGAIAPIEPIVMAGLATADERGELAAWGRQALGPLLAAASALRAIPGPGGPDTSHAANVGAVGYAMGKAVASYILAARTFAAGDEAAGREHADDGALSWGIAIARLDDFTGATVAAVDSVDPLDEARTRIDRANRVTVGTGCLLPAVVALLALLAAVAPI